MLTIVEEDNLAKGHAVQIKIPLWDNTYEAYTMTVQGQGKCTLDAGFMAIIDGNTGLLASRGHATPYSIQLETRVLHGQF